jgi:uncharacterized protein YfiM (DUF2279 family)
MQHGPNALGGALFGGALGIGGQLVTRLMLTKAGAGMARSYGASSAKSANYQLVSSRSAPSSASAVWDSSKGSRSYLYDPIATAKHK